MKIVKGDIVYLRSGKDVAGISRLPEESRGKSMPEQIADANKAHKGVRGKVLRAMPKDGKVVVEGVNMVTKHQRPKATAGAGMVQQGGRIKIEAPIPASRVMLVCPNCDKPTRVGIKEVKATRQTLAGEKTVTVRERVCKHCNEIIPHPTASSVG
jgi:large subunit ribosomal protein L24